MSRNMKSDALDAKFEEFLRELSTDDDSVRDKPSKGKDKSEPNLWWAKDKQGTAPDRDKGMEAKPVRSWLKSAATVKVDSVPSAVAVTATEKKSVEGSAVVTTVSEPKRLSVPREFGDTSDEMSERLSLDHDSGPTSAATERGKDYTQEFESTEHVDDEHSVENSLTKSLRYDDDHDEANDDSDSGSTTARDEIQPYNATVLLNPASLENGKETNKAVASGFGLQTFIVQGGGGAVRGIQEILQEVEAVERSIMTNNSESESSASLQSKSEPTASGRKFVRDGGDTERLTSERNVRSRLIVPTDSGGDQLASASEDNRRMVDKITTQDRLISGYQKENERLYEEGKRLRAELKNIAESESDAKSKAMSTYGQRIDALLAENLDLKLLVAEKQPVRDLNDAIDEISETTRLKRKILKLESAINAQHLENKSIHEDVDFKANRISSLEQQVKKLEELLRARHPDSISALVLASDIAGQRDDSRRQTRYSPRAVELLEQRIRDLESQLVTKGEEANRSLQAVQSRHALLMARYKERIVSLEQAIGTDHGRPTARSASSIHRPMNSVAALEKELDGVRDRYRKEVTKLKSDVAMWQARARPKADDDRAVQLARIRSLVQETRSQQRQIRELREGSNAVTDTQRPVVPQLNLASTMTGAHDDNGTSDFSRNEDLLSRISNLQENVRVATAQADVANASNIRMKNELHQQQLLLQESRNENDRLVRRVFQLSGELETCEAIVKKLQNEQRRAQLDAEHVPLLRARIDDLESSCRELRSKLADADLSSETLERRHFAALQLRVREVEGNYERRCAELETLLANRQHRKASDDERSLYEAELLRWKRKVHTRNQEIERFRSELDAILRVLEELQSRGVTAAWQVQTAAVNH